MSFVENVCFEVLVGRFDVIFTWRDVNALGIAQLSDKVGLDLRVTTRMANQFTSTLRINLIPHTWWSDDRERGCRLLPRLGISQSGRTQYPTTPGFLLAPQPCREFVRSRTRWSEVHPRGSAPAHSWLRSSNVGIQRSGAHAGWCSPTRGRKGQEREREVWRTRQISILLPAHLVFFFVTVSADTARRVSHKQADGRMRIKDESGGSLRHAAANVDQPANARW